MAFWSSWFGKGSVGTPAPAAVAAPAPAFEDRALAGNGLLARSGAPFPFNKIMPYDATGGEKLYRAYQQSAWVQRAIKKISGPIAAVSLDFTIDGEAFQDPEIEAFWQQPGVRLTKHDFLEATVGWLKLEGEAFWLLDDSSMIPFPGQRGRDLTPIIVARPDRMFLHKRGNVILGWDYVDANGKHHGLLPEQVIQIIVWNPYDEFRGLAEMLAAKDAAEADFFAGKYAKNQFANNGDRGPYIIAKSGLPTDTQRQMIVDQLREKRELAQRGVYKPIFLAGDISVEDPKVQAPDATFISARLENRHEVALAFGVPPSMFDVKASYSIGSASDWFMLISETCIPTSRKIEQAINRVLLSQVGKPVNANFNWDEHPVIQTVRRERWDTATKMWSLGVPLETINDQLDLKLPECPGWETAYLPFNVQPVEANGQVGPAPDKNPDYAEDKIAQMRAALDPVGRAKLLLSQPSPPMAIAAGARPAREIALWKKHMNDRKPHVNAYQAKFNKALFSARAEVLAKLARRESKSVGRDSVEPSTKAVATDFLFNLHEFTGKLFAAVRPAAESSFLAAGNGLFEEIGRKDPWQCAPEKVLQFVKQRENLLSNVPDEIFDEIKGTLQAGLDDGDPIKDIAAAVRGKFNEISTGRARTIAMTETAAAYGTARNQAMQDAGIAKKQWLTSGNDNVREAHAEANGQTVDADEAFDVGGESLRFPGDPDGSPENIINCHCVAIAVAATENDES